MKCSKAFAIPHSHSHDPSRMKHVNALVTGVDVPQADTHVVTLHLEQHPHVFKLRLTPREAKKLADTMARAADNCGIWEVM